MIKPTTHRLIVKQKQLDEFSKEHKRMKELGWAIPETEDMKRAQAGVDQGYIKAIGPSAFVAFGVDCPVVIGDLVAFAKYSGKVITDPEDNEEYVALNDEDIIAILTEKAKDD